MQNARGKMQKGDSSKIADVLHFEFCILNDVLTLFIAASLVNGGGDDDDDEEDDD